MLAFRRSSVNGVQHLFSINDFRQLVLFSTSISTEVNPNFVNYLVDNLGLSRQQALSTSSKFTHYQQSRGVNEVSDSKLVKNGASVISFLKKIGFQQSHIRSAIDIYPRILMFNVDKTLVPKTEALQKLGFSGNEIADIVSLKPKILLMSMENAIIPAIQTMRDIMGCDAHVILMLKKSRKHSLSVVAKKLAPNVAVLRSYGIPIISIRKFLLRSPSVFLQTTDHFQDIMISVQEKFGIPVDSPQFLAGAHRVGTSSQKTIESKMQIYKSFGWTDSHIATLVSSNPCILGLSQDNIKKKLDFLMNEVGFEPSYLAFRCSLFTCSLEKRTVPRHKVLLALKQKGLIKENLALYTTLTCPESQFLKKFVLPFKEVHEVYSKFAGVNLEMLTLQLSKPNSTAL